VRPQRLAAVAAGDLIDLVHHEVRRLVHEVREAAVAFFERGSPLTRVTGQAGWGADGGGSSMGGNCIAVLLVEPQ
jgi:hypothetical protein